MRFFLAACFVYLASYNVVTAAGCVSNKKKSIRWFADASSGRRHSEGLNQTLAAVAAHPGLFKDQDMVIYAYSGTPADDKHGVDYWRSPEMKEWVSTWLPTLHKAGLRVHPYFKDTSNILVMDTLFGNQTAWIKDAVAVVEEFGFDGAFVDYEAEKPDWYYKVDESTRFAQFLEDFGFALRSLSPPRQLGMYVTDPWTPTTSNYPAFANAGNLTYMVSGALYGNISKSEMGYAEDLVKAVAASANPKCERASIGLGPYYYGFWNASYLHDTLELLDGTLDVTELTIFQLNSLVDGLPKTAFWWDALEGWLDGKIETSVSVLV